MLNIPEKTNAVVISSVSIGENYLKFKNMVKWGK